MALPSDVQLVAVTCGSGSTFFGEDATVTVEVAPVLGGNLKHLVHKATGSFMTKSKQTFTGEPGQPATFTVPNSSQPETWIDGTGAFFSSWGYLATIIVRAPNGETERWTKSFTPALGQTTIDLDLVPDGQIGGGVSAPVPPVTSVNGQTGAVVVEGDSITPEAVAANLPERLSETALSAAIGESIDDRSGGASGLGPSAIVRARMVSVDTEPIMIAGVGDSYVAGDGVDTAQKWIGVLAAAHSANPVIPDWATLAATDTFPTGVTFANGGRGGFSSLSYLSIPEATALGAKNPTLLIHIIGANDWPASWGTPESLATRVAARIDAVDAAATLPVAHWLVHGHERYDVQVIDKDYSWGDYLAARRNVAQGRPNVAVVDIAEAFRALGIPGSDPLTLMQSDKVHNTAAGHKVYAGEFGRLLNLPPAQVPEPIVFDTVLSDNFNRADGVLAGSAAQTGQVWTAPVSNWTTQSNVAHGGTSSTAYALIPTSPAATPDNMRIKSKMNYTGTVVAGVLVRALDELNNYQIKVVANSAVLGSRIGGTEVVLKSVTGDMTEIHNITITLDGNTIHAVSEKFDMTHTITNPEQSTTWNKVGLRGPGTSATFDDLLVEVQQ